MSLAPVQGRRRRHPAAPEKSRDCSRCGVRWWARPCPRSRALALLSGRSAHGWRSELEPSGRPSGCASCSRPAPATGCPLPPMAPVEDRATGDHAVPPSAPLSGPLDGQTVLVTGGAGAVGHYAVQLAKWAGARVIATVSSREKAVLAAEAGADHLVNYRTDAPAAQILELTSGAGVDRIVDVDFGANLPVSATVIKDEWHHRHLRLHG